MCDEHDAKANEELAKRKEQTNKDSAHKHYLEAASIYTLLASQQKNTTLHHKANSCYHKAHALQGKITQNYDLQELAKRTLHELDALNGTNTKHHHHIHSNNSHQNH